MTVDSRTFRDALGRFASGVCVVTTINEDATPAGVTISAFASLSLEPPLVLFCIGKRSANLSAWLTSRQFSVNVLSEDQTLLSQTFAAQNHQKFVHVQGGPGENGCFCIEGCLVTLECRRTRIHDEGDHYIIIGLVERAVFGDPEAKPLVRFRAGYGRLD
jgi:flavin reductase (DIM6/NTAB) family NADH-FMN oxidoreductase RutF